MRASLLIGLCLFLAARAGFAQTTITANEAENLVNYAYGTLFGTGFYELDGRSVAILQFPVGFDLREATKEKFGMRLELPMAIGVQNYDFQSIPEFDLDNLATLSVMPGNQVQFPAQGAVGPRPIRLRGLRPGHHQQHRLYSVRRGSVQPL